MTWGGHPGPCYCVQAHLSRPPPLPLITGSNPGVAHHLPASLCVGGMLVFQGPVLQGMKECGQRYQENAQGSRDV